MHRQSTEMQQNIIYSSKASFYFIQPKKGNDDKVK